MQVFRKLAGYSYGRADVVRRAMAKKHADELERERTVFINGQTDDDGNIIVDGAVRRGVPAQVADKIFDDMSSFASYAFNKSHAAAYAVVTYQTAYLKYHYPREYMAALLTSVLGKRGKLGEYTTECLRMGISVLPPNVNESGMNFTVSGDHIRFGMLAIQNLGAGVISQIIDCRERGGRYEDFYDFCERLSGRDVNRRAVESLVKSGAMDGLGANRRQMLAGADSVLSAIEDNRRNNLSGQMGLFALTGQKELERVELPKLDEFSLRELLEMEREVTELYFSGHPLNEYEPLAQRIGAAHLAPLMESDTAEERDGDRILLVCMINTVKLKLTKKNETMAFVQIEDISDSAEMLVFPSVLERCGSLIRVGSTVIIEGHISSAGEDEPKIICDVAHSADNAGDYPSRPLREPPVGRPPVQQAPQTAAASVPQQTAQPSPEQGRQKKFRSGVYLRCPSQSSAELEKVKKVLRVFDGPVPVYVYFEDQKQLTCAPRDLWTTPNGVMLGELARILGEPNIKYVQ